MKRITLLFFALSILFSLQAQPKKTDLVHFNLKGYVKSVTEISWETEEKFGELVKGKKRYKYLENYNKSGFRTEFINENFLKDTKEKTEYSYDAGNNVVEREFTEKGKTQTYKNTYNGQGKIEETNVYDHKGKLVTKTKYKYNAQGLNHAWFEYNAEGKQVYASEMTYNPKGLVASSTSRDEGNKIKYTDTYKYDSRGNTIENDFHYRNDKGGMNRVLYLMEYNNLDQKIEETSDGAAFNRKTYTYDLHGNLLNENNHGDHQFTYVYTYDAKNNWTKKVRTYKAEKTGYVSSDIMEREFKYYDVKDIPAGALLKTPAKTTEPYNPFDDPELLKLFGVTTDGTSLLKGARTWEVISTLPGKSLSAARAILKKAGYTDLKKETDEVNKMDMYYFYPEGTKDFEGEPVYWIGFVDAKAVFLTVDFEYESGTQLETDLSSLKKSITSNGFAFSTQQQIGDLLVHHYLSKKGGGVLLALDKEFDLFTLMFGEPKYIKMAME